MDRDERIRWAREQGAQRAQEAAVEREAEAQARKARLESMTTAEVRAEARGVTGSGAVDALGPDKTPSAWTAARLAIRQTAIEAAREGRTVTYDTIRIAAYEATGKRLGYFMTGRMCAEVNQPGTDGCLLSSIIVSSDTGRPGSGFEGFAAEQGFHDALPNLQRQAFNAFSPRPGEQSG